MKILLVNRWYPPYSSYGGVAIYNYYLAHALSQLGHEVSVLAKRWSRDVPSLNQDNHVKVHLILSQQHSRWHRLPLLGWYMRSILEFLYSVKVAKFIQQIPLSDQPDVVEFADVNAEGFVNLLLYKNPRTVVRCHLPVFILRKYYQPQEQPYDTEFTAQMEKYCLVRSTAITAPSNQIAQEIAHEARLTKSIIIIPNPLDTISFAPLEKDPTFHLMSNEKRVNVLFVGRFDRIKGIEVLAEAIPLVVRTDRNIHFNLIGDDRPDGMGSTWIRQLQNKFASSHLQQNVHFLGTRSQPELPYLYAQNEISVVPSIIPESFSYTCAQAMACGKPVIVSDIGGMPETLGEECGLKVPPNNPRALADAILTLSHNASLRSSFGQAGRERALNLFSPHIVAAQMLDVYQSISK